MSSTAPAPCPLRRRDRSLRLGGRPPRRRRRRRPLPSRRRAEPAADACPFGFATKFRDPEFGIIYYGHRFYSPKLGRFLNRGPLGEAGGLNPYAMAGNDPVGSTDYLGLLTVSGASNASGGSMPRRPSRGAWWDGENWQTDREDMGEGHDFLGMYGQSAPSLASRHRETVQLVRYKDKDDRVLVGLLPDLIKAGRVDAPWLERRKAPAQPIIGELEFLGWDDEGGGSNYEPTANALNALSTDYTGYDLLAEFIRTKIGNKLYSESTPEVLNDLPSNYGAYSTGNIVHLPQGRSLGDNLLSLAHEIGHTYQNHLGENIRNPSMSLDSFISTGAANEATASWYALKFNDEYFALEGAYSTFTPGGSDLYSGRTMSEFVEQYSARYINGTVKTLADNGVPITYLQMWTDQWRKSNE